MTTSSHSLRPRLLVIDDEAGICMALSLLLEDLFHVETAETVQEGLDRLSQPYALVLLDLRMPGVRGYEYLERVKAHANGTPVAVLSATVDRRTCDEVRQRGAVALIEKPFTRRELVAQIRRILDDTGGGS